METIKISENTIIECKVATRDWYAWQNLMPPKPDTLHVKGSVQVPNPGVEAYLQFRQPQGFNPAILFLDLVLVQQPGIWPRVLRWKEVSFYKMIDDLTYTEVHIFCKENVIEQIAVDIIS